MIESNENSPKNYIVQTSSAESNLNYEDTADDCLMSSITTGTNTVEENVTKSENSDENESFNS